MFTAAHSYNQEWAAVNIAFNTQNEDKPNKIHNTNIEN
jgi:hypothetical protein